MSSYNIKWIAIYIIYSIVVFWYLVEEEIEERDLFYFLILLPAIIYLALPFFLKKFGNWKVVVWIDKMIDKCYEIIKECVIGNNKNYVKSNSNNHNNKRSTSETNYLEGWVKYYQDLKLWIFPYPEHSYSLSFWKGKSDVDYKNISKDWSWNNNIGLKLLVGKKGIRVLELPKGQDMLSNQNILNSLLIKLGLPSYYPWIIERDNKYGIVVDTPGVSPRTKGMKNRYYGEYLLVWEGEYVLPPSNDIVKFYNNIIPKEHPIQISDDILFGCIESLQNTLVIPQMPLEPKEEKEGFWLRFRTILFQVFVIIALLMIIGLTPPPLNIILTVIIIVLMLSWNKLFGKDKKKKS